MIKPPFPVFSKQKIASLLAQREFEDLELIKNIENIFFKKRGYVFKMPPPGTPVILLLSGGIDSVVLWFLLLKVYRLHVYPLTLAQKRWNFLNGQYRSITFYSKTFKSLFSDLYHRPFVVRNGSAYLHLYSLIAQLKKSNAFSPSYILEKIQGNNKISMEIPGIMTLHALTALHYSDYLLAKKGLRISDFFVAVTPRDGLAIRSQTLTSIRLTLLDICIAAQDFSLQFTSLPIEKELGIFHEKGVFVSWIYKNNLNLSHTHTCTESSVLHCGKCNVCKERKATFFNEGIKDTTFYWADLHKNIYGKIQSYLTKKKKTY